MKALGFLILITVLASSCMFNSTFKINGQLENGSVEEILVVNDFLDKTDTLSVVDDSFTGEIEIADEQIVSLVVGKAQLFLYAQKGDEISVNVDEELIKKGDTAAIKISGSPASELLLQLMYKDSEDLRALLSLKPDDFEKSVANTLESKSVLIDEAKQAGGLTDAFISKVELMSRLILKRNYKYYTIYHARLAPQDTSEIPEGFDNVGGEIELDNENLFKELPTYKNYVLQEYDSNLQDALGESGLNRQSTAYYNLYFDKIMALNTFPEVKNELGKMILTYYARMSDSVKTVLETRYIDVLSNANDIIKFEEKMTQMNRLKEGKPAPTFSYPDINGNVVSSTDLKGKVIYIDVWATWCGPCKGEIPYLKTLESELHDKDIAFVSISVDSDKRAWESMVKEDELKGYQLYAKDAWNSQIIKDYLISGIPRFIIIDKDGNLVSANATRPSNPETKNTLLQYAE